MSVQSDAAMVHIEKLLEDTYPNPTVACIPLNWVKEYHFAPPRRWAFDYAVPAILCANLRLSSNHTSSYSQGAIEIDGGTFQGIRTGHSSGVGLRAWREKNNEAMRRGWKVFHYAPEEIIKAGRKSAKDRRQRNFTSDGRYTAFCNSVFIAA